MKIKKGKSRGLWCMKLLSKLSKPPASEVTLGDTSDVGVSKSSLHICTLVSGKILVSDFDSDRPQTNDSLQNANESEVDFSIVQSDFTSVASLPSCKVVLEDFLPSIQTEKSKLLNVIQENTHSDHSQRLGHDKFRQQVNPKLPIAWPKTNDNVAWQTFSHFFYLFWCNEPLS